VALVKSARRRGIYGVTYASLRVLMATTQANRRAKQQVVKAIQKSRPSARESKINFPKKYVQGAQAEIAPKTP
jgi:hypothetical protein